MANVMLAEKWCDEDPMGWWISEKLDGVRGVWKGGKFLSRENNAFACPEWFAKKMPEGCELDGELWGGRRQFQKTVGIVKNASRGKEWEFLTFMVFDVLVEGGKPVEHKPFEERLESVRLICAAGGDVLQPVPMQKCRGREHLQELLAEVERRGGEGLMLRRPGSLYERRRSKALLKVKTFHDEEAIVVGHETGKGRLASLCGALLCETPDKRRFKVGSGLSDAQRSSPPKIGAVITYRYQELTNANIPRFPTLAGERIDLEWRKYCATYKPPDKHVDTALRKTNTVLFSDGPVPGGSSSGAASSTSASAYATACTTASAVPASSSLAPASTAALASAVAGAPEPPLKRKLSVEDVQQRGVPAEDLEDFAGVLGGAAAVAVDADAQPPAAKKRRTAEVDKRPVCGYGSKCYRRNPAHFVEFAHPWLDDENDDAVFVAPLDVSSSAAGVDPVASAEVVPAAPTAAATSAPMEAAAETSAAVAHVAPAPELENTPMDLTAENVAGSCDVRVNALRSLLSSLVKDAAAHAERMHFQHLLDLLNAGPSEHLRHAAHEPLPPLPPPDRPPPLSMIRCTIRSKQAAVPASLPRPAATSAAAALAAAATVEALPEDVAAALVASVPAETVEASSLPVNPLVAMGFPEDRAMVALAAAGGNVEAAAAMLLDY